MLFPILCFRRTTLRMQLRITGCGCGIVRQTGPCVAWGTTGHSNGAAQVIQFADFGVADILNNRHAHLLRLF